MFFSGKHTKSGIANWVREELKARGRKAQFSRQKVYEVIEEAVRLGYVVFRPPLAPALQQRIADLLHTGLEHVAVVNYTGAPGAEFVAGRAAEMLLELIRQRARAKRGSAKQGAEVHLGLGAGFTTLLVAKKLGDLLRTISRIDGVSKLVLHAMNSGFSEKDPLLSPLSFFSYFADSIIPIEHVMVFSPSMVPVSRYAEICKDPGVVRAFERAREIEIVVTSLASQEQAHGLLNQLEDEFDLRVDSSTRVGDLQFRPFSTKGPVADAKDGYRAVTLFELDDFVRMVKDGKNVVLVSGPTRDGGSRTKALLPLLTEPSLRVWSHLCLDVATAEEVVEALSPAPRIVGGEPFVDGEGEAEAGSAEDGAGAG
jgi:hypothetical protein